MEKVLFYAQRFSDSVRYTNRESIRLSVIHFHHDIHRSLRTTRSDDRRLKAVCEFSDCLFRAYFLMAKNMELQVGLFLIHAPFHTLMGRQVVLPSHYGHPDS